MDHGLVPGGPHRRRRHVYFSAVNIPDVESVYGIRPDSEVVVAVDTQACVNAGVKFYLTRGKSMVSPIVIPEPFILFIDKVSTR